MQKLCDTRYHELCAKLGELHAQETIISQQKTKILADIASLNEQMPSLLKFEKDLAIGIVKAVTEEKNAKLQAVAATTTAKADSKSGDNA